MLFRSTPKRKSTRVVVDSESPILGGSFTGTVHTAGGPQVRTHGIYVGGHVLDSPRVPIQEISGYRCRCRSAPVPTSVGRHQGNLWRGIRSSRAHSRSVWARTKGTSCWLAVRRPRASASPGPRHNRYLRSRGARRAHETCGSSCECHSAAQHGDKLTRRADRWQVTSVLRGHGRKWRLVNGERGLVTRPPAHNSNL